MNFAGYVALRRGLLTHLQDGRLTNAEALVLVVLIMLADKSTGAGTINAPTLRTFLPELSYDAAKRVLGSLDEKRYIFRDVVPFSKRVYRYWVHKYTPTGGPHKMFQTDCSQAFETRAANDIRYVKPAPEGALEGAPESALDPAPHYETGKEKRKKETTPSSTSACAPEISTNSDTEAHTRKRTSEPGCALLEATHGSAHANNTVDVRSPTGAASPVELSPADVGLRWSGYDGAFIEIATGRLLGWEESQRRLGKGAIQ